ncbi:FAD-dependent monooxygenase [Bradyrhizobium erythrophlei]|jgi:3-(3-hydroxy-phenyl)propionate hydroxylase|uniref:3-(3-hydroxy-phenyl)propionate hydroxylase n=1 Tax=Bradyrhizobium erythrophlei TaxID=1437360 RepID=A0A1M5P090_9BRAD|nr:FAD-dependent monooxygenase [Bradyrhizobium erythrophlei]SHG94849.1 3-(3-hydroxy-phenyl)propionate hydroxylase [Bradyrhizobium erythrophlei]
MRPAGKGPLESLYFNYPTFPAGLTPELEGVAARHPVVIVGAGPIGMTAALALARYGIRSVLIERKDTFNDGSRAICIARPSMHILERIGAVAPFVEKALGWRFGRSYYRGEQIFRLEMPHPSGEKYLPMYNLQQQYIEQFLHDAVSACDLIDMRWQTELSAIECGADGVSLGVSSPVGDYRLDADYVLAADGARSPIRSMLGLRLKGENYEGKYVIADIRMDHDFPTERRAFFEPSGNPGGTVLIHKQPDDIWRVDYQLREGESEQEALREENIRARVGAILTDIGHAKPWELEWWSIYSANTLCLDDYRHGRVFFVGDAAHIVPIFGVRGLNNGLADADNLGWKLGLVLSGEAGDRLLDSYSPERRGATLDVFANATKSTRFMTPPTHGWRLAREAALSLSLKHDFPRGLANPRQMQPYTYSESPLTPYASRDADFASGPISGSAAPNAKLADGSHLLDRAGNGMTVILFCDGSPDVEQTALLEQLRKLDKRFVSLLIQCQGFSSEPGAISDGDGAIARLFDAAPGALYLLRPDLHIAGRWKAIVPGEILRTASICLGRRMP